MTAHDLIEALEKYADPKDAVFLQRFFKTGKGQYGEGDVFIGVRVPATRAVCKAFKSLSLDEIQKLLDSTVHEHRLAGVILLANKYSKADALEKQAIYDMYLRNVFAGRVNNWDLVDVTAEYVVGEHLRERPRDVLFELAKSDDVWQKRVALLSSFCYIKRGDAATTLQLAEILVNDPHDLIQKAVGWMLREIGKRVDEALLINFLNAHYQTMPRTALRYAIERLSPEQKQYFMQRRPV